MELIHPYQPSDYAQDAVTMLALALDSQLEIENSTSSNDLDEHIASTEFVGETVRLDEILIIVCTSLYIMKIDEFVVLCRAGSKWTVRVIAYIP